MHALCTYCTIDMYEHIANRIFDVHMHVGFSTGACARVHFELSRENDETLSRSLFCPPFAIVDRPIVRSPERAEIRDREGAAT